jgi:hypothetical protein
MGIIDRVYDETWHRLLMWTWGQARSERLAGQILAAEGFEAFDPSHPLGGQDGGADGRCQKDGNLWILAVYFPRGQQAIRQITDKLTSDVDKGRAHNPYGVVFVTNQELRLAERADLRKVGGDIEIELYHLERVAHILDRPPMA